MYVLGHRDGRFCDAYIRPVAVNGLRAGCQEIHVSVMADGTESFAPSSKPLQAEVLDNETDEKLCNVFKVPLTYHVGKSGVGKCFGGAFTKAFDSFFKAVKDLTIELQAERA